MIPFKADYNTALKNILIFKCLKWGKPPYTLTRFAQDCDIAC